MKKSDALKTWKCTFLTCTGQSRITHTSCCCLCQPNEHPGKRVLPPYPAAVHLCQYRAPGNNCCSAFVVSIGNGNQKEIIEPDQSSHCLVSCLLQQPLGDAQRKSTGIILNSYGHRQDLAYQPKVLLLAFQVFSFTALSKAVPTCTQHRTLYETAQQLLTHLQYYHKEQKKGSRPPKEQNNEGAIAAPEETDLECTERQIFMKPD